MTQEQRIKADLAHFLRTGEIPEPWAVVAPEPVDAEFDARLEEMNRDLDALESGCLDSDDPRHPNHPLHCQRPCCRPVGWEP